MKQMNIDEFILEKTTVDEVIVPTTTLSIAEMVANNLRDDFRNTQPNDINLDDNVDFSKIVVKDLEPVEIIRITNSLLRKKHSKTYIAEYLGITRKTLYKYLNMSTEDLNKPRKARKKKDEFELYKPHIIKFLNDSPELSSSQIHFLLTEFFQEFYGDTDYELTVSKNTINNYCKTIRKEYSIEKTTMVPQVRDYVKQTHDIVGRNMQVDLGEYRIDVTSVTTIKVYFIVFTLCFSRMMFVDFLNRPFKSEDVVISHLRAFKFFGGVTDIIIYDQDTRMLSKENFGDYELTEEFGKFVNEYEIKPLFCYASDPESKGVVENGVKFVKQHFLNGRKYKALDVLKSEALNWCNKVAQRKHGTTLKRPEQLFQQIEKQQLRQVKIPYEISYDILTRSVSKYNTISFEGNNYTLPIGTYSLGTRYIRVEFDNEKGKELIKLYKADTNTLLWEHNRFPKGSGKFVTVPEHHNDTTRALSIEKAIEKFTMIFTNKQVAIDYAQNIAIEYSERRREIVQLNQLYQIANTYIQESRDAILEYCALNELYGTTQFNEVATSIALGNTVNISDLIKVEQQVENINSTDYDYVNSELEKYNSLLMRGDEKDDNNKN